MTTLDIWRCPSCSRILAERVTYSDVARFTAVCWGCGQVAWLPETASVVTVTALSSEPSTINVLALAETTGAATFDLADDAANLGSVAKKGRR